MPKIPLLHSGFENVYCFPSEGLMLLYNMCNYASLLQGIPGQLGEPGSAGTTGEPVR